MKGGEEKIIEIVPCVSIAELYLLKKERIDTHDINRILFYIIILSS